MRRRRKQRVAPFIQFPWEIHNSEAFNNISYSGQSLLLRMLGKAKYNYKDHERYERLFEFTYSEAKRYGYSSSTYFYALNRIRSHGFIDKVRQGGSHGEYKATNLFRLSERWRKFGTDEFIDTDQDARNDYVQSR